MVPFKVGPDEHLRRIKDAHSPEYFWLERRQRRCWTYHNDTQHSLQRLVLAPVEQLLPVRPASWHDAAIIERSAYGRH